MFAGCVCVFAPPALEPLCPCAVGHPRERAPHAGAGFNTFSHKLAAFTLAGALAGLAGFLFAAQTGFVNPELMGFHLSAHAIMMVILGGMGNFAGAIVGAFSFEYLLHVFKDLPDLGSFRTGKHWQMWMGLFIVALIIFAPKGILGLINRFSGGAASGKASGHD